MVLPLTVSVRAGLSPHALTAITETVPPDPAVVTLMELVVEVPVQPLGNDHV